MRYDDDVCDVCVCVMMCVRYDDVCVMCVRYDGVCVMMCEV